jgi:predicted patatin/cPLA2 family phospholipase
MAHPVVELIRERARGGGRDGSRLVLAIEGGGMRGSITGGMALELDQLGLRDVFDDVYGSSAGALNAAWLLSGAAARGISTWSDPALRTASIRRTNLLRGRPIVDSSYLTEVVYERLAPMPFERILAGPAGFHPLGTDATTGEAVDLAPFITDRETLKLALRATTALPLLSGRPIPLGGRRWFDGGVAESIPYRTALLAEPTHLLVLRSRRHGEQESANSSGRSARVVSRYLSRYGPGVAEAFLARAGRLLEDDARLEELEAAPGPPAVLSIRPPAGTASISRLERDSALVTAGIEAGRIALREVLAPAVAAG